MALPHGIAVFERGWLSANNILLTDRDRAAIVDTGYWTHADQTVALVQERLGDRRLDLVLNTHLHSDHCGGNHALQLRYPACKTCIPPGQLDAVREWDTEALSYAPTGQHCPLFRADGVIVPGSTIHLGGGEWQVHAAPGHDPHSVILFDPVSSTLLSADALWRHGFGVVFPELEGHRAFDDVSATLDIIQALRPLTVIPGHGPVFHEVREALGSARRRLEAYASNPLKHASHAGKVLIKFRLLEVGRMTMEDLRRWAGTTRYFGLVHARYFPIWDFDTWLRELVEELVRSGAAILSDDTLLNG